MKNLVGYREFQKLNEYGWDSYGEFGEITVNGVVLKTKYICLYDTPNFISFEVYVEPTNKEMLSAGVYSPKYFENDDPSEKRICIFHKGTELSMSALKKMGGENVRDLEDFDIIEKYSKSYNKNIKDGNLSSDEFVKLSKEVEYSEFDDMIVIRDNQKNYNLLAGIGAL